jgi:hypothetical protein
VTDYDADGISVPGIGDPIFATITDDDGPAEPAGTQTETVPAQLGAADGPMPPPADAGYPTDAGAYGAYGGYGPPAGDAGAAPTGLGIDLAGVSRRGAAVELTCEAPQTCKGKVRIKATKRGRLLTLATKRYRVMTGRAKVVRLKLSRAERRLVTKLGELTVEATGTDGMQTSEHFGV